MQAAGTAGRAAAVVLAGGQGSRVGAPVNKAYLPLAGAHVASWSLRTARRLAEVGPVLLVIRADDAGLAAHVLAADLPDHPGDHTGAGQQRVEIVIGGATRQGSEHAALDALAARIAAGAVDVVALHDAARPLASDEVWRNAIRTAEARGGAVPALPVEPVVGVCAAGLLVPASTLTDSFGGDGSFGGHGSFVGGGGGDLVRVQTPQAFRAGPLLAAYEVARERGVVDATDTAGAVRACADLDVRVVPGSPLNLKITYPHDLAVAERIIALHRL